MAMSQSGQVANPSFGLQRAYPVSRDVTAT